MPFIGNQPAKVPLTSADITDGIITNADISSTAGITLNKLSGNPNFRNIVINGDMQIAQRNTNVASITADGYYTCDRWNVGLGSFGTWTQSQSTDVPSGYGFSKSLKMDCTTAQASPASGSLIVLEQKFEGQNLQYLRWGTANAKQLTLSFWCKHTKTGTNIVELIDADNSDAVSGSYTQSVSNTWEFKTITFPAKTSGALDNDNASSLRLRFIMGAGTDYTSGTLATTWIDTIVNANRYVGQVNNADSTANDFLITGVQLEAGTSATDFEFLPYDVSLARCLRYFHTFRGADVEICQGGMTSATNFAGVVHHPVEMRASPTFTVNTGTDFFRVFTTTGSNPTTLGSEHLQKKSMTVTATTPGSLTAGHSGRIRCLSADAKVDYSAEL